MIYRLPIFSASSACQIFTTPLSSSLIRICVSYSFHNNAKSYTLIWVWRDQPLVKSLSVTYRVLIIYSILHLLDEAQSSLTPAVHVTTPPHRSLVLTFIILSISDVRRLSLMAELRLTRLLSFFLVYNLNYREIVQPHTRSSREELSQKDRPILERLRSACTHVPLLGLPLLQTLEMATTYTIHI